MFKQIKECANLFPWQMLALLVLLQILIAFVGRSLAPLGPLIGDDLSLTKAQIGLLPAALFIGQSIVSIPAGFLTDRLGTKKMMLIVTICLGGSFFVMAYLSFFMGILLMIVLGGLGYGASHPAANRGIIYWFHIKQRGTAMGIKQMGVTVGSALSALLLLPIANILGWRLAIQLASILLLIIGSITFLLYREPLRAKQTTGNQKPSQFFRELFQMAKDRTLVLVSFAALLMNGSQGIFNTYLVLFSYEFLGINLILSGILLVIAEVGGSVGRIGWGIISDKLFESKRIIIILIISICVGIMSILLALLPESVPFWLMTPIAFIFGFCVSGFNGIWMNAVTEMVPSEQSGAASGFSITIGSGGPMFAPPLFGFIIDITGTYTISWLLVSLMMIIVTILLWLSISTVKQQDA